jgi:hypothetical protein
VEKGSINGLKMIRYLAMIAAIRYPLPSQLWPIEAAPVLGSGVQRRENGMILIIGFSKRFKQTYPICQGVTVVEFPALASN